MQNHAREYFYIEVISLLLTVIPAELLAYAKSGQLSLPAGVVAGLMILNTVIPPLIKAYRQLLASE